MRRAAALLLVIGSFMARAQTAAPGQTATLHATANLVVVDVTVTDDAGNPVHGLKLADFHLSEDKAAQRIRSFEEHSLPATTTAAPPEGLQLQPGVFTNAFTLPADIPVNVLLLDTLNTPMASQAFVHHQLEKYLQTAKLGTRMTIFALTGGGLVMLQGLTADPALLRLAVARSRPRGSPIPAGNSNAAGAAGIEAQLAEASPELADSMQEFEQDESDINQDVAAEQTLQALNQIARYLAGVPGRKNLIWFAGSFPLTIRPAGSSDVVPRYMAGSLSGLTPWAAQYRDTLSLLAHARVAIYPADANGLPVYGLNQVFMSAAELASRNAMLDIAEQTGGHAFFNTNGLAQAVDDVTANGASYYTLAYTPTRSNPHGEFRTIRVELEGKSYKLAYRRGYFAEPNDTGPAASPAADKRIPAIKLAARYTAPPETQIRFFARLAAVAPATEPVLTKTAARRELAPERFRHYEIDFSVDPAALEVVEATDGLRHAHLEYMTLVYDTQGRIVGSDVKAVRATWTATQFAAAQRYGVRYSQQIAVPVDGVHTVRVLIHDLNTDKIGSIDLPVSALQPAP